MVSKQEGVALARDAVCEIAHRTGLSAPRGGDRDALTIVTFHRVLPVAQRDQYPVPGLVVTPEELDFCLSYLTAKYSCHPLGQAFSRMRAGTSSTKPLLAITFDDGQLDNLVHACPVLKKHDLKATFYIVPRMTDAQEPLWHDRLGFATLAALRTGGAALDTLSERCGVRRPEFGSDRDFVSAIMRAAKRLSPEARESTVRQVAEMSGGEPPEWARLLRPDEIVSLKRQGHEIGSHTNSHSLLPQCDDVELKQELSESKRQLENWLGEPITHFCYPNGDHDPRTARAVRNAGYDTGVTTTFGINNRSTDPYRLGRFDITSKSLRDRHGRLSCARLAWGISRFRKER